jgi:SAM-dependent methyltransferase
MNQSDSQKIPASPPVADDFARCPVCRGELAAHGESLRCTGCEEVYPVVAGTPVLIRESNSLFRKQDFTAESTYSYEEQGLRGSFFRFLPELSKGWHVDRRLTRIAELLQNRERPRVLVLGAGNQVEALQEKFPSADIVGTDVAICPGVRYVCDGHDLPFADGAFDLAISNGVMEHVLDPFRCAEELHRVLAPDGLIYVESPFIHPGHSIPYDFHRFTHIGHRRLWRGFEEIAFGVAGGPGQALANVWQLFLLSFSTNRVIRAGLYVVARFSAFWLKYLDYFLVDRPESIYACAGSYFLGRRSTEPLGDRELIERFRP